MKFGTTAFFAAAALCGVPAASFAENAAETEKAPPPPPTTTAVPADAEDAAGRGGAMPAETWAAIAAAVEESGEELGAREPLVKAYAEELWERSRAWRVSDDVRAEAIAMLADAYNLSRDPNHAGEDGGDAVFYTAGPDCAAALERCEAVVEAFPTTLFAAEALFRQSVILTLQRRFEEAFDRVRTLVSTYPGSDRIADALAQGYIIAETGRQGVRPRKFGGRLPWLKDRKAVLRLYDELYALAPQSALAPRLLFRKGVFASEIAEEIFEGDRVRDAIGAFEMLIGSHPESPLVPEAYLLLAGIYEKLSPGAEWDQVSTRRALNYYTDFYTLFPEHPQAEYAYGRTEALRMRLAENRLSVGDFYYVRRNNMRAALVFYNEAITHAPESEAADRARERIEKIRRGKRADLTFIDWLFGRYPAPRTTDFADAPSQKSLEEMGFRSADSLERADEGEAAAAEDAAEPRRVFADPAGE